MKIYDCFIYFDEDLLLDVRLNILDKFVDKFVIVESKFSHSGEAREPNFKLEKYKKYKEKIEYILLEENPSNLFQIKKNDPRRSEKIIINANLREFFQRNAIIQGLSEAKDNDIILISDVDEIPNLEDLNLRNIKSKILMFEQSIFYYKLNRYLPNFKWFGTKACIKKNLICPQWLRNIKSNKYSFYRIDTIFSDTKYINKKYIKNGGWHFSNLKNASDIELKLKSYLHHHDYDSEELGKDKIDDLIRNNETIYDMFGDKNSKKYGDDKRKKLEKYKFENLPEYIKKNKDKLAEWID